MKNKLVIGMLLAIVLVFTACQKDIALTDFNSGISNNYKDGSIVNGRFFFASKETLSKTIKRFKKTNKRILETKFANLYKNGFRSLKPIVNSNDEMLISKLSNEINSKKSNILNKGNSTADDDSDLIPDPLFAAVINKNNEIIVGDSIYKFTKDKGLFFASIKDSTYLFNYLKNNNQLSNKQLSSKTTIVQSPCSIRMQKAGITQINNKISQYVAPPDIGCSGGSGGNGVPPLLITTQDENLQQLISTLPECSGSGSFFQNIFGKSLACKSYYDTRHRIKTEFWDQKWLIYASVGVLTKTQHRTLGIWWASKSDEIHLGINRILLKYNFNEPIRKSFTQPVLFNNTYKAPLYLFDGTFKVRSDQFGQNYYVDSQIDVIKNKLPFFNFNNSNNQILNIYIPHFPLFGNVNINLTTQDITTPANIKALYKLGLDYLKGHFNSGAKKDFVVTYQKTPTEIEVLYFGEHYKVLNDNKIKRKFYKAVDFSIGYVFGINSNKSKFIVGKSGIKFRDYTYYNLDFYGMARRGSMWKGNRLIRTYNK